MFAHVFLRHINVDEGPESREGGGFTRQFASSVDARWVEPLGLRGIVLDQHAQRTQALRMVADVKMIHAGFVALLDPVARQLD
jgi:hypothetical protein